MASFRASAFFPSTGNNTDWKPFVIWMPKEKCDMLFHPQDPFWVWLENTNFTYLSTQTLWFFSVPTTICFGILSAEFSPTLIGGDSKAKFILGHGARKLHPLGPWSSWSKAATGSPFLQRLLSRRNTVITNNPIAKHKKMFNWNRVIVCTHSRISRWPPVYLLSLRFTAYPFEACWAAHPTRK